jgi:FtsZ-binding cell division protein ZapB
MATTGPEIEVDTLTHLEDRVQKAVALVQRLRQEKEAVLKELTASKSALEDSQIANLALQEELEGLQTERKQVRGRLEKLLGHIDQLGAA